MKRIRIAKTTNVATKIPNSIQLKTMYGSNAGFDGV